MKKKDLKFYGEYFGCVLPIGKIVDREDRLAIVSLYASIAGPYKEIAAEIEAVRHALVAGHESEVDEFSALVQKGETEKASAMTECVRINNDFQDSVRKILDEDIEVQIKAVPASVLVDALVDCGYPSLNPDAGLADILSLFGGVITE